MNPTDMNHIRRASRRFRLLFTVLIVGVPVLNLFYWAFFNWLPAGFRADLPVVPELPLPAMTLALAFLASLLPVGVALYGLVTLRALFGLYERSIIFSVENVRYFRRLGYVFIFWVIANVLFTPLVSAILSFANPPGERAIVVRFGTMEMSTLIVGAIVLLVAWVMNEGRKLEDEQAHTV